MEIKLSNGRYVASQFGGLETVRGDEELAQRIVMKLASRRGGFAPMPDFGSRLYLLTGIKPSERELAARQYIIEALSDEQGLTLTSLELGRADDEGEISITAQFTYDNDTLTVSTTI